MMLRARRRVAPLFILVLVSAACGRSEPASAPSTEPLFKPPEAAPGAAASATGTSRYFGLLPCADCSAIRTELTLVQDPKTGEPQTYELSEAYLGKPSQGDKPVASNGKWSISRGVGSDSAVTVYTLDGGGNAERARRFERVSETELRQLDSQGQRIQSPLNYVLTRMSDAPVLSAPASAPLTGPAPAPGLQPAAMVTDLASGWPVNLMVGQEMTARLTADRASGRWSLRAGSDAGIVAMQGEPAHETPDGAAAVEVFRLKAARPGKTTLTFDFKKGDATARSVSYPVSVQ